MAVGHSGDIDDIQAGLLRTLASPHRLRIIHRLGIAPCGVTELARDLGLSQAAASQHLAVMRSAGIVDAVRDGRSVTYELSDREILAACGLMRSVLVRRLSRLGDLAAAAAELTLAAEPDLAAERAGATGPVVASIESVRGGAR
jgi:DNA-binding transcriptional ArsR family regulator